MKKIMISQPMKGLSNKNIKMSQRNFLKFAWVNDYKVVNTFFENRFNKIILNLYKNKPLFYFSKAIKKMAKCDIVYFAKGWHNARGCRIEHDIARAYGLEIVYE